MKLRFKKSAALLAAILISLSPMANADTGGRSYAVMSLVGNALHIHTMRPDVGTRTPGESSHVFDIAEPVFDSTALKAAHASIKQVQPGAKIALLMSQDAGLYRAQNAMFETPDANMGDRDYLIGLLKAQGVSHLVLVTKLRDIGYFELSNGSVATGVLEGLGFYIDDTTKLRNTESSVSSSGMLGPFAHIKIRLLDATTLAVVREIKATKSLIVTRPSAESNAMEIWTTLPNATKIDYINGLLTDAVDESIAPLLNK